MADSGTVDILADALANVGEKSGGRYDELGKPTKTGDRAYGKYQIMGANIPAWSKEATGTEVTPDEFVANPQLQDQVAKHRIGKYYDQYGNARDVASMWHSGAPYDQAVKENRQDMLGTKTQDYATNVADAADTIVTLPDGNEVNLGVNPTPELRARVKAKILSKWPDLGSANTDVPQDTEQPANVEQTEVAPTTTPAPEEKPLPGVIGSLEPYRALHEAGIPLDRNATVEDTGAALNKQFGLESDHKLGRYLAAGGKPFLDAVSDFTTLLSSDKPPSEGVIKDSIGNLQRLSAAMHPVVAAPEAFGNTLVELAADAKMNPTVGAILGVLGSMYAGSKIPLGEAFPTGLNAEIPKAVDLGPRMPLKGTPITRAAAAETASAATAAEQAATAARTAETAETAAAQQEAADVASRGQEWVDAQKAVSAEAAPPAAGATRAEAEAAMTPAGIEPRQGGQAISAGLEEKLKEWKEPTQGIYNVYVSKHGADIVPAEDAQGILDQIDALNQANRLTGSAGSAIKKIGSKIETEPSAITVNDLNDYKTALDDVLPGGPPPGSSMADRALYDFKLNIRDTIRSTATGEERAWLDAADSVWRDVIIGRGKPRALGPLVKRIKKDPETAVERLFGNGVSNAQGEMASAVMRELGDHPAAEALSQAFGKRLIQNATDTATGEMDPKALLKSVGNLDQTFADSMLNPGQRQFFKIAQQQQDAAEAASLASKAGDTAVKEAEATAAKGAKEAEKTAGERISAAQAKTKAAEKGAIRARGEARRAAKEAEKPNMLASMTAKGLEVVAGEAAASAFGHPGLGPIFMARFLFPADRLATYLANNQTANLLARALKTPANSAVVPVLMRKIQEATNQKPKRKAA